MKTFYKTLVVLLAFLPSMAFGQFSETLISDRPGQSMSPNTVGKKVLQFQFGYTYSDYCNSAILPNDPEIERGFLYRGPNGAKTDGLSNKINLKSRFGIFEKTEISADLTMRRGSETTILKFEDEAFREDESNWDNYLIGFGVRQNLINNADAGFNLGAELQFFGAYYAHGISQYDLMLVVAVNKQLTENFSVTGNAGSSLLAVDFFFTCNLGYSITEKLGVYAEYYPIFSNSSRFTTEDELRMTESFVNTGFSYIISPNFMVDVSGGFLVTDNYNEDIEHSEYNIQIGLTSRLDWRK